MQGIKNGKLVQQAVVVLHRFPKTESGIEEDVLDTCFAAGFQPFGQKSKNVLNHVLVLRRLLHGVGSALVVHYGIRNSEACDGWDHGVVP